MGRIRTIKPEFFTSPDTAKASPRARLLYVAMWCWADDWGVGEVNINGLLGFAFPDSDDVGRKEFQGFCKEVAAAWGVEFYTVAGRAYYQVPSWDSHQKTQRRAERRHPPSDSADSAPDLRFMSPQGISERTLGNVPSGKGKGTGEREQGKRHPRVTESDFERAWIHWPKKTERAKSFEKFKTVAAARGVDVLTADIERFGRAYARTTEKQFVPALVVWLNRERWTDELPGGGLVAEAPKRKFVAHDD